jgi:hypothetical protein
MMAAMRKQLADDVAASEAVKRVAPPIPHSDRFGDATFIASHIYGKSSFDESIHGSIDRMTGDVRATFTTVDVKTSRIVTSIGYSLKCRPTQRTDVLGKRRSWRACNA